MKKTNHIKKFIFNVAYYTLSDEAGREVILKIDYHHKTFSVKAATANISQAFQTEVAEVARDLLSRKHGVNFAKS